jgi:hypothetical protein
MRHHKELEKSHDAKVLEVSGIFNRVGIDLQFGFPATKDNYIGLLVIVEYLTKYVVAFPIKSKSAIEIAERLFEYIAMFGPPKEILSDQGTEFNNQLVRALLTGAGTEHRVTSAYHPRTNGLTERMNGTIAEAIRKHATADHDEWPKWIPYVLMAYRTRVHSTTGYTPFELMFGRKFNSFKDWRSEETDLDALWKRTKEIKTLVEFVQPKEIENIAESQERQKKNQNKNSIVEKSMLPIGSRVFVKVMGIQNKLQDRYKGPFMIFEHTKNGNYKLKNVLGESLEGSFTRERLKPVGDNKAHDFHRIDRILEDRVTNGKREFLVKWANQELGPPSWESADNFADTDIINKYLAKKNKPNETTTAKRPRGRPPKSRVSNLALIAIIWIHLIIGAMGLKGNFMYCQVIDRVTQDTPIVNIYEGCVRPLAESRSNMLGELSIGESTRIHVLAKVPERVKGIAIECSKRIEKVRTYMNFIGERSSEPIESTHAKVNRDECEYMAKTNKCEANDMQCDDPICSFEGSPKPEYYYLSTFEKTGVSCKVESKLIVAKDENEKLFGTDCTARDLECSLKKSIIIWQQNIIRRCEFEFLTTISNLTLMAENVLYQETKQWAFQVVGTSTVCPEIRPDGIKIFTTTEGVFLSKDKEATKLSRSELNLASIHELMLSEEDGHKIAELVDFKKLSTELCEQNLRSLRALAHENDQFERVKTSQKEETIVYVKDGQIVIPKCVKISHISTRDSPTCHKYIPVSFRMERIGTVNGFLTPKGILRKNSPEGTCGAITIAHIKDSDTVLWYDGKKTMNISPINLIKVDNLNDRGKAINLPHYKEIVSEIELFKIIHWDNSKRNKEDEEKEQIVNSQDAKIETIVDVLVRWINSIKRQITLWIVGIVIILTLVLTITIAVRVKRRKQKKHYNRVLANLDEEQRRKLRELRI